MFCVVATHNLSKELYLTALKAVSNGNHVSILYVSDDVSEQTRETKEGMKASGIAVYQIMSEDEIVDILSQE
jgi:hypothetical protein